VVKNIPNLIIITSPEPVNNEFEIINSLFNEGLECLHVRKPDYDLPKLEHWLQQINMHNLSKIVIHSHFDLTEKIRLKGIHFTNAFLNRTPEKDIFFIVQKANSEKLSISASVHKTEELKSLKFNYDYIFLSPVFDSISKQGYKSNFNLKELSLDLKNLNKNMVLLNKNRDCFASLAMTLNTNVIAREERPKQSKNIYQITYAKNIKVIALGGIDEGNIGLALQSGFAGVALLGAILLISRTKLISLANERVRTL